MPLDFPCLLGSIGSHRAPELGPELGPSSIFNNLMQLHQILEQVNWRKECPTNKSLIMLILSEYFEADFLSPQRLPQRPATLGANDVASRASRAGSRRQELRPANLSAIF